MLRKILSPEDSARMSAVTIQHSTGSTGECNKAGRELKGTRTGKEK